jgi:hypothetical protein
MWAQHMKETSAEVPLNNVGLGSEFFAERTQVYKIQNQQLYNLAYWQHTLALNENNMNKTQKQYFQHNSKYK